MHLKVRKEKIDDVFCSILVALILFSNIAIGSAKYLLVVLAILFMSVVYCFLLTARRKKRTFKVFSGLPFLWVFLFALEMFVYGYWGKDNEAYSLRFHLFNVVYIIILLIIMYHKRERLVNIISNASGLEIIMLSIFIICNEFSSIINVLLNGSNERIGATMVGNENTTAISYIFLMIPIMYQFFYKKQRKWFPVLVIGFVFMFLTGSKKSIISLILIFVVLELVSAFNMNELFKNLFKLIGIIGIVLVFCYFIPVFRTEIWDRIVKMAVTLLNFTEGDQSSTGLRITFVILALVHAWDKPFFGHGWNSFAEMYGYSTLYQTGLYTHCNYTEVLFSFGLIGFFLYYWFPIFVTRRVKRNNNMDMKIFGLLYCVILFFVDIGTVSCYQTILPFLGFSVAYICSNTQLQNNVGVISVD